MVRNYSFTAQEEKKLKEPLVSNFFKDADNHQKFSEFIESPNHDTKKVLDSAFKTYYKRVKVIAYMDKLIYFFSIDLFKKRNKYHENNWLILDKPIVDDSDMTLKDNLTSNQSQTLHAELFPMDEILEDLYLHEAWRDLSLKQKEILTLKYQQNLTNVEIAAILSESKQVISYNHKKAIKILRQSVENN